MKHTALLTSSLLLVSQAMASVFPLPETKSHHVKLQKQENEIPFLRFSNATFLSREQLILNNQSEKRTICFPILHYGCPYRMRNPMPPKATHDEIIDGDVLFFVDDSVDMVAHYFHFIEHLLGVWNFFTYQKYNQVKKIIFAFENSSEKDLNWAGLNGITKLLINSLFPNATITTLREIPSDLSLHAQNIYVSSRLRAHGIPEAGYNNMHGTSRFLFHKERLCDMRDLLFSRMGITSAPKENDLRITYCKRSTGRIMMPAVEDQLITAIRSEPRCSLNVVDFATISFHEQLQLIANTDLFIGVHGNGLTHLLFLPNNATVLEYYQGGESAFFRLFAQLRGLAYYGNSKNRWVRENYLSLENKQPFQSSVTAIDLPGTMQIIRKLNRI